MVTKKSQRVFIVWDGDLGEYLPGAWLTRSMASKNHAREDGFEVESIEFEMLDHHDRQEILAQRDKQMIDDGIYRRMSENVFGGDPLCHHIARADFDGNGRCIKCGAWESK